MLIVGDISGIQDFLFDVRESGGKQASTLRFRSFRLQIIADCLARRFLWACGLDERRLLFVAAGKFAIDARGVTDAAGIVSQTHAEVQRWLLESNHGRLRFAVAIESTGSSPVEQYDLGTRALQRSKLEAWSPGHDAGGNWSGIKLVTDMPFDTHREGKLDVEQGRQFVKAEVVTLAYAATQAGIEENVVAGVRYSLRPRDSALNKNDPVIMPLERFTRHIPKDANGMPIEFVALADQSRGDAMLGVLKADADSLGLAIRKCLTGAADLSPLQSLSKKLEDFFGKELDGMMSKPISDWRYLYTVFSGGDDVLLVGPWNIVMDFAGHLQRAFTKAFADESLTISAGVALVKPKFPIRLSAQQAEELLEHAKTQPAARAGASRDQIATLGGCWKWADHDEIIDTGKKLSDWADIGQIQRGWLHTVLELALLRRGEANPRDSRIIPAMATSRLAYHARKWPKEGPARQWINARLKDFDRFRDSKDPITLNLPAIIRYALLATRSPSDKE